MKTYEIYGPGASSNTKNFPPIHIVQAEGVEVSSGPSGIVLTFHDGSNILHAVVTVPGMFVRTVEGK